MKKFRVTLTLTLPDEIHGFKQDTMDAELIVKTQVEKQSFVENIEDINAKEIYEEE